MSSAIEGGSPRSCSGLAVNGDRPGRVSVGMRFARRAGDAEIRDAHAAARVEQHVAGFQIPMDDAALVRVFQRLRDVDEHGHDFEIALAAQPAQIATGGQFHGQRDEIAFAIRRLHFQDGRMIEPARDGVLARRARPTRLRCARAAGSGP